jgi:hypothetical protein
MPDKFDPILREQDSKPGPRPAASYALLYPHLVELVRPLGYALTVHGSMNRDFDMVAVPWTDEAVEPEKIAAIICEAVGGYTGWDTEPGKLRPHGRRCWLIWFNGVKWPFGGGACIDLSIMPRTEAAAPPAKEKAK